MFALREVFAIILSIHSCIWPCVYWIVQLYRVQLFTRTAINKYTYRLLYNITPYVCIHYHLLFVITHSVIIHLFLQGVVLHGFGGWESILHDPNLSFAELFDSKNHSPEASERVEIVTEKENEKKRKSIRSKRLYNESFEIPSSNVLEKRWKFIEKVMRKQLAKADLYFFV